MDSWSNFGLENISPKIYILIFLSLNKFNQVAQFLFAKTLKKSYALNTPLFWGWGQFSGTNSLNWTSLKVDFSFKYRKIDPITQNIGVFGAKTGLKKSIFLTKPVLRSI